MMQNRMQNVKKSFQNSEMLTKNVPPPKLQRVLVELGLVAAPLHKLAALEAFPLDAVFLSCQAGDAWIVQED